MTTVDEISHITGAYSFSFVLTVAMSIALDIRSARTVEIAVASDLERAVNELYMRLASLQPGWLNQYSCSSASSAATACNCTVRVLAVICRSAFGLGARVEYSSLFFPEKSQQRHVIVAQQLLKCCCVLEERSSLFI